MTTTLQQIVDRAADWSVANGLSSLTSDNAEMINRIASDERALFDLAAQSSSFYYAVETAVTSTSGSSARTIDTSAITPPVGRILRFVLASGDEVYQVDLRDTDAELSPRYYLLGTTMKEVSNDWSSTTGVVSGTLTYIKRPAELNTTGALTQTVTLDDRFVDILEMRLAWYLAHKDVGRDIPEIQRLEQQVAARVSDFQQMLSLYGGAEVRSFNLPVIGAKR
jgi:hypothetical protein